MAIGLASGVIYGLITQQYLLIIHTVFGFLVGMAFAYLMFYTGQWGGGDSKLIMGMGAILGFNVFALFGETNLHLLYYLIIMIFVGALYGLVWTLALAVIRRREFIPALIKKTSEPKMRIYRLLVLVVTLVVIVASPFLLTYPYNIALITLAAALFIIFYLWIFVKIVEETCMIRLLPIDKLTEGDWIATPVIVGKKYITGPKELGITREQIALLKKYAHKIPKKSILVKEGIPFIPVFFISYIILLCAIGLSLL